MKKRFIFLAILLIIITACEGFYHNKSYWWSSTKKRGASVDAEIVVVDIGEDDASGVDDKIDPFKVGDWNNPNYQGWNGEQIKDWTFHVTFDDRTVPTYKFEKNCSRGHGPWTLQDDPWNLYTSKSPDGENTAQGYEISELTIYRYDGKNPLIAPDIPYNLREDETYTDKAGNTKNGTGRMGRFLFYRIKGKSVIVGLDQHLIAIDTYSKLIFAYGAIISTTTAGGKLVPNGFAAIDGFESGRGAVKGVKLPFYLYDPLGFIKEDGTVVLYDEYKTEMGADPSGRMPGKKQPGEAGGQVNYAPQIHDPDRGPAGYVDSKSAGCSPYFSTELSNEVVEVDSFCENVKGKLFQLRKEISYQYQDKNGTLTDFPRKIAAPDLHSWEFDDTGKIITHTIYTTGQNNIVTTTTEIFVFVEGQSKEAEGRRYKNTNGDERYVYLAGNSLYDNSGELGRLNYNDPGIEFILRVRGATFVNGDTKYEFSSDGGHVTVSGIKGSAYYSNRDGVYYYDKDSQSSDEKNVYTYSSVDKWHNGSLLWGRFKLDNYDFEITSNIANRSGNYENLAYRTAPDVQESDQNLRKILMQLANKTFQQREKVQWYSVGELYGWKLMQYTFSSDGRKLTVTEKDGTDYKETYTTTEYNIGPYSNGSEVVTYTYEGTTYKISITGNQLKNSGTPIGEFGYTDPGPHFLLRVAGKTYEDESGETKYEFNKDGTELSLSYRGLQYVVVKAPVNVTRKWTGNLNDSTESSYGDWDKESGSVGSGVPVRLQDGSGKNNSYAEKAATPGTNRYIRTKMTAYGWQGATWEYEAVRR